MTVILLVIEFFFTLVMGIYFFTLLKGQQSSKIVIDKENKKEMDNLNHLRSVSLTMPLTEKSRPKDFDEIIGQERGIKALKAAICGPNPQNVIIYGPPGVGKTAAARLVLEYAKKISYSPFKNEAKFIEIDATTVRFDDRGIADPLIGSVHDPIYQGAGSLGIAGIPQPKLGAVTKAHGGILFIDEIGELHPTEMNKLLKVLEDRRVFLDSAYYNSSDNKIPAYIKEIFENGLPADFRLIGATTRSPEEICPALRSRCVEIFFKPLLPEELKKIALNSVQKVGIKIEKDALEMVSEYSNNGRDAVNLIQLAYGIVLNEKREKISLEDIEWVVENGQYSPKIEKKINEMAQVGYVNGLAIYGANIGAVMEIEASAIKIKNNKGCLKITGIVEEEEIENGRNKMIRKSTARCSVENVVTMLERKFNIHCNEYDVHVNFPGGMPVDGPSAGISVATAIYSAIKEMYVDNRVAMTGEISLYGKVKPVGGVNAKIAAAIKAGAKTIIIPKENWQDKFEKIKGVRIVPVSKINEVFELAFTDEPQNSNIVLETKGEVLLAKTR
jgi:Lon-like ATP-dependent protease